MIQKSIRIGPQSCLGGVLGHLGPKMAPRWPQEPPKPRKSISGPPSWEPFWSPKSINIVPKSDPKGDRFYDRFGDRFLERFGANLAPSWPPKTLPKWTQVGSKIDASWSVDLRAVFGRMFVQILLIFYKNMTWPKWQKP